MDVMERRTIQCLLSQQILTGRIASSGDSSLSNLHLLFVFSFFVSIACFVNDWCNRSVMAYLSHLQMYSSDLYSWWHHCNRRWENIYILWAICTSAMTEHASMIRLSDGFFYDRLQLESQIGWLSPDWTMRLPICLDNISLNIFCLVLWQIFLLPKSPIYMRCLVRIDWSDMVLPS
jgi:hypothetical protein